jgi:hypothetical protein
MEKVKRIIVQQEKRRKTALQFKDKDDENDMMQINKNFKSLNKLDQRELDSLSKVIENSIVFTLSKSGKFSKFKSQGENGQASNAQKRKRKFMIGMANNTHAH